MSATLHKILVVGGNGFIGSAVCKTALARGMQVVSVSSSGQPFQTTKGHRPDWTNEVEWHKGDALKPETFARLFPEVGGVVHTLGTVLESREEGERPGYKESLKGGDLVSLVGHIVTSALGSGDGPGSNPLAKRRLGGEPRKGSYETLNRDAALRVCEAFVASSPAATAIPEGRPRPFVYISAEDIFRPLIPARYIETKREAEHVITEMMQGRDDYRPVFIRPSLVYHAHYRPLTTLPAVLMDLSASLHEKISPSLPTPSSMLRALGSLMPRASSKAGMEIADTSPLESVANALVIPPIHVDSVAQAICVALEPSSNVDGVVDVGRMRELIGW
ncbi:mitochondrial protein [Amanita muscaria]